MDSNALNASGSNSWNWMRKRPATRPWRAATLMRAFRFYAVATKVADSLGALCSPDSREGRSAVFRPGPSARKPVEDLHEWRREVIGRFLVLWPVHGFYL